MLVVFSKMLVSTPTTPLPHKELGIFSYQRLEKMLYHYISFHGIILHKISYYCLPTRTLLMGLALPVKFSLTQILTFSSSLTNKHIVFPIFQITGPSHISRLYNWVKVFKNGPSKICGRQPLQKLKWNGLLILY